MMKKVVPLLIASMMVISVPAFAQSGLGKGGGGGNGGGSGGGNSGGGAPPPPVRSGGGGGNNGNGNSGGSGGGKSSPPIQNGGGSNSGGSGRDRGGNSGSSNSGQTRDRGGSQEAPIPGRTNNEESRSGRVNYSGSNNQIVRTRSGGPIDFSPPPVVRGDDRNSREARGEDRVNRGSGNYRSGYYHYNNQWNDSNFWYPHYQFNYSNNCVPSPWYGYSHLPGYISVVRVRFDNFSFEWRTGDTYRWQSRQDDWGNWGGWNWGNNNRSYLDQAVDDIYDAFRDGRVRNMDRLIPTRDSVWIELDRYSSYRVSGDDFYDLMEDLIEGTRTRDYRIREVRRNGKQATVIADHSYIDSWGRSVTSRHYYGLEEDRRGYQIVAFRVDH